MSLKLRSKNILNCFPKRTAPTLLPDREKYIQLKDALGRFLWFILNCFPKRTAPTLPDSENYTQWKDALGRFLWFNLPHLGAPFTVQIKRYQNEDFTIITRNNAKRKRGSNFHTKSVTAIWNSLTATKKIYSSIWHYF